MTRTESQISLRARFLTDGTNGTTRLAGKVVLVDASDVEIGVLCAYRYASEGADVALAYSVPCDSIFIVQRQIEALGSRCVLYEIELDDEWNCGLVVQSTAECLGPIDIVVNRSGHVKLCDGAPITAAELRQAVAAAAGVEARKTSSAA